MTTAETEAGEATDTIGAVPRWRRILCGVLVVLVCILAPLSILAVWTRNTLLNTDQYVETVGPLAENSDIQQAIADRIQLALTENVDLSKEVEDALPAKAAFVAPFVARGIEQFVHNAALTILESDQFQTLWDNANRRAHDRVVAVLTGNEGGRISTENGQVTVQLGPVVEKVQGALSKIGVDIFSSSGGEAPKEFVLFESDELTKIQGAVDLLDKVAIWLPILMLVMLIVAIWISPNRRRTVLRTAIGIAIGMALLLIIFNVVRRPYLDAFRNPDAAGAAYDQILSFLRLAARTALAVAIVVAIGAWLAGPGHLATRIRDGVKGLVNRERAEGVEQTPVGAFVARHKMALRAVVIGIGLLILVVLSAPTPLAVLVIAVLVVVGLLLIEFLGRGPGPAPEPPAKSAEKAATKSSS